MCRIAPWLLLALVTAAGADNDRFTRLMGWGGGEPDKVVPAMAEVGFTDILVWQKDPAYLRKLVAAGQAHHVGVWVCVWLGDVKDWQRRYPGTPPPLQVMNDAENQAVERLRAEVKTHQTEYQYGGEPLAGHTEALLDDLLCPHQASVERLFEDQLRDIVEVPGLTGVAFDYFGYRNYRCCRCAHSQALLADWRQAHPQLDEREASDRFSRDSLVGLCNRLSDYARFTRPGIQVSGHVYPVFLPEPLYGNQLNWDLCGQTAAWFFEPFWSLEKITSYSRNIASEAARYHSGARGAGLIGIYLQPGRYAVKTPARIEQELRALRDGGLTCVQVCSVNDVLKDAAVREVFASWAPRRSTAKQVP